MSLGSCFLKPSITPVILKTHSETQDKITGGNISYNKRSQEETLHLRQDYRYNA